MLLILLRNCLVLMQNHLNKVDIFSFGASIIECFNCSGIKKLPQNGELWQRIRDENPSSFINFPDNDLAMLIDNMTEKDPNNRYSIEDVINSSAFKKIRLKTNFPNLENKILLKCIEKQSTDKFKHLLKQLHEQIIEK